MTTRKLPPMNLDVDDESDAVIYIQEWCRGVQRQRERFVAACKSADGLIEGTFLVIAAFQVRRSVDMLLRHEAGVLTALTAFDAAQPDLRPLRNALEHHDDYLRGQGTSAKGKPWFPLGTSRHEGAHFLLLPPLDGKPANAANLDALADDVLHLAQEAVRVANASWPGRMMRPRPVPNDDGPEQGR